MDWLGLWVCVLAVSWVSVPLWPAWRRRDWTALRRYWPSLLLRGVAALAMLLLYATGGIWRQAIQETVPARLEVLVDVSQSVVNSRDGGDMAAYRRYVEKAVEALRASAPVPLQAHYRLFAGTISPTDEPGDWAGEAARLHPEASDLESAITALEPANGQPDTILLVSDGLSWRGGRVQTGAADAIRTALARNGARLLALPVAASPDWWPGAGTLPRIRTLDLPRYRRLGEKNHWV